MRYFYLNNFDFMNFDNLSKDRNKKISFIIASSVAGLLLVLFFVKVTREIPEKITESQSGIETVSSFSKNVASVFGSIKSQTDSIKSFFDQNTIQNQNIEQVITE